MAVYLGLLFDLVAPGHALAASDGNEAACDPSCGLSAEVIAVLAAPFVFGAFLLAVVIWRLRRRRRS